MKRQQFTVLAVTIGLVGLTASFLVRVQSAQRLEEPGLRLVSEPLFNNAGKPIGSNSVYFPAFVLDFKSRPGVVSTNELSWLPDDTTYGRREYVAADGFKATLTAVMMGTDRTSIHKPQICIPSQGWKVQKTETVLIPIERPHPYSLAVKKMVNSKNFFTTNATPIKLMSIYVYWFVAKEKLTAEHSQRMWWMAEHLIRARELQRWAYVSCFSVCEPGQETATFNRMKELIAATVPDFQVPAGAPIVTTASAK
jgi:hypothetical protein